MTNLDEQSVPSWYYGSRKEMLPFVPITSRRVLDVGCGEGKFGASIKHRNGAEVWGIEYDPTAAKKAVEILDNVLVGDAFSMIDTLESYSYDCICFLDVLEHLVNPEDLLVKSKRLLREEGCILVSVPNVMYVSNLYRFLVKKDWRYVNNGVLDRTHLRFFTKKSIKELTESAGYKIFELKGINSYRGILFNIFNLLTFGHFRDSRHLQFALAAKLTSGTI